MQRQSGQFFLNASGQRSEIVFLLGQNIKSFVFVLKVVSTSENILVTVVRCIPNITDRAE